MQTAWWLGLLGVIAAPALTFAGVWYSNRSSRETTRTTATVQAQTTAAETATVMAEAFYGRLIAANEKLTMQADAAEKRVDELIEEMRSLRADSQRQNQRIGAMEADNARLAVENESLRKEIDRLVDEVQRERSEKYDLSRQLADSQAERRGLERRIEELERKMADIQAGANS